MTIGWSQVTVLEPFSPLEMLEGRGLWEVKMADLKVDCPI